MTEKASYRPITVLREGCFLMVNKETCFTILGLKRSMVKEPKAISIVKWRLKWVSLLGMHTALFEFWHVLWLVRAVFKLVFFDYGDDYHTIYIV